LSFSSSALRRVMALKILPVLKKITIANEAQWQIPSDAGKSIGRTQSATPEDSGAAEVNPAPAWGDLVVTLVIVSCL
jgi:hypothetical protein